MKYFAEGPWYGTPRIILGVEIGTTESAVSFTYLNPGSPQSLHRVTAWPGQESQKEGRMIPSLVYYNSDKAVCFGTETQIPQILEKAKDEHWELVRHFNLHLHPDAPDARVAYIEPLPIRLSLLNVYTDFMVYLLKHTKDFFESRTIDGRRVWADLHQDMMIVFAHSNSWGLKEQNFLRKAAVAADYISSSKANSHIQFVKEAEASIHYFMFHSDLHNRLELDTNFVVCDAGESSAVLTVYRVIATSPLLEVEEKRASRCVHAGSNLVRDRCEQHLAQVLHKIDTLDEEDRDVSLQNGVRNFETETMRVFDDMKCEHRVDLGVGRLRRDDLGIQRGRLTLEGSVIAGFFDVSISRIIESIYQQISGIRCKHIILLGEFSDSLYLRRSLMEEFGKIGCLVSTANDSPFMAVADGAIIWCTKRIDVARTRCVSYEVEISTPHASRNLSFQGRDVCRPVAIYDYPMNQRMRVITKGLPLSVDHAVHETYWCAVRTSNLRLDDFKIVMVAYTEDWNMNQAIEVAYEVEVDIETMRRSLKLRVRPEGNYYYLFFTIVVVSVEPLVLVEYERDGKIHVMPTRIIPKGRPRRQA